MNLTKNKTQEMLMEESIRMPDTLARMFLRSERTMPAYLRKATFSPKPIATRLLRLPAMMLSSSSVSVRTAARSSKGWMPGSRNLESTANKTVGNFSTLRPDFGLQKPQLKSLSRRNEDLAGENSALKDEIKGLQTEREELTHIFDRLHSQVWFLC